MFLQSIHAPGITITLDMPQVEVISFHYWIIFLKYAKRLLVAEEGGNVLRRPPIRVHFVDVHSDHVNEVAHHVHLVLLDGL
ncbi:hypothetical protein TYRP_002216 [Tyrophagus putrescentiae]|nr:hypothetical protein TYRP_002216 [Tyrophagus putrescentiae]